MNVYKYDELTKEYTGVETALLDPLERQVQGKEVYLLPANATFTAPLVPQGNYVPVWNETMWEYKEDNRGKEYWLADDEYGTPARTMKELGAFPANAVFEAPKKPFEMVKEEKLNKAGSLFAQKRDARRFVKLDENRYYGFDCASEDITNFLARWTPLAMMGGGESQYKVWLNETEKDLVMLSLADYNLVYQVVSESQLQAYDWYKVMEVRIKACTTKEELEAIVLE